MSEIEFLTLAAKFKICLIFTERHFETLPKAASYASYQNWIITTEKNSPRAVSEIKVLKAKIKGVFSKAYCCSDNI